MKQNEITLGKCRVFIPEYYQQVESMPDDPVGSVPLMAQSENAMCFALLQEIAPENAMPFENPQSVIDGIHECLGNEQGLIEVASGSTDEEKWIYSIVKTLMVSEGSEGVQYVLTLDRECNNGIIHVQGFFDECGLTGTRDAAVFQMLVLESNIEKAQAAWMCDPYDPNYMHGVLMNKSEQREFDGMFPSNPLSMAREFVDTMTSGS